MSDIEVHADYESVSCDYLQKRQLKKGAASWVLLASLGVSYVISGDFAGWNFGLAEGGFGGLFIATLLTGIMYSCLTLSLAELSSSLPTAGGGYSFVRRTMGPLGGFLTGTAILLEYTIAPAAIAIFIGNYCEALFGLNGPLIYALTYILFIGLHLWGAGEALKIMMVITLIATLAIIVFIAGLLPHFSFTHLLSTQINHSALGASALFPQGYLGIWHALPFAIWFFLAVEGVPLAAEEAANPARDIPRGIITAMIILLLFAAASLFLAPGAAGVDTISKSGAPLADALRSVYGTHSQLAIIVNLAGLAGLIASFFSIIFAGSRQLFALSRAGYMPRILSLTSSRKAPTLALIIPGVLGFILSLTRQGDLLITTAVFGAALSYIMMMLAHIRLRLKSPDLPRPYKTPGGIFTSGTALIFSVVAFISTFLVSPIAAACAGAFYLVMIIYFICYSRHHLVASAPEEEFATLANATRELGS